jgi:hypothetical protein
MSDAPESMAKKLPLCPSLGDLKQTEQLVETKAQDDTNKFKQGCTVPKHLLGSEG